MLESDELNSCCFIRNIKKEMIRRPSPQTYKPIELKNRILFLPSRPIVVRQGDPSNLDVLQHLHEVS